MIMTKRVFIIHGWEGKPDNHWFPWLSWELKARGFDVYAITMPHPEEPKVSEWIAEIKAAVGRPTAATFFVGHSLGCIATLRYFEKLPAKAKVGGAVFVAGFSGNLNIPEIAEFYSAPLNMAKAKSHCSKFVTIFSDDDRYVPLSQSFDFQKTLGAKAILERGKGHFTKSEGVDALPSVFKSVLEMSS
jgi:hypothetical protein